MFIRRKEDQLASYPLSAVPIPKFRVFSTISDEAFDQQPATASLGRGLNSINLKAMNTGVVGDEPKATDYLATDFKIQRIYRYRELFERLEVKAHAKWDSGFGSADLKLHFIRSMKITSTSSIALISMKCRKNALTLPSPRFTELARRSVEDGRAELFLEQYGDLYCSDVEIGGDLYALVEFNSVEGRHRQYINGTIEASAGTFQTEEEMVFQMSNFEKLETLQVQLLVTGTLEEIPPYNDLYDAVRKFPPHVNAAGGEVGRTYSDYSTVLNRPPDKPIPTLQEKRAQMESIAQTSAEVKELRTEAEYIESHSDLFEMDDPAQRAQFDTKRQQLDGWLAELEGILSAAQSDPIHYQIVAPNLNLGGIRPLATPRRYVPVKMKISVNNAYSADVFKQFQDGGFTSIQMEPRSLSKELDIWGQLCVRLRKDSDPYGRLHTVISEYYSLSKEFHTFPYMITGIRLQARGALAQYCQMRYRVLSNRDADWQPLVANDLQAGYWTSGVLGDHPVIIGFYLEIWLE